MQGKKKQLNLQQVSFRSNINKNILTTGGVTSCGRDCRMVFYSSFFLRKRWGGNMYVLTISDIT